MSKIKAIVWDWNGTLLNDVDLNVDIVNEILTKFQLSPISKEYYKMFFTFPIREFYEEIGFDFQNNVSLYDTLIDMYNSMYKERLFLGSLYPNSEFLMKRIRELGVKQMILSGQNQSDLDRQMEHFGIRDYFQLIKGSDTMDASDKKSQLFSMIKNQNLTIGNIVIIGDTLYEWKLAREVGCRCVLVSHGHQNENAFLKTAAPVFSEFSSEFLN